jgi:hypothetical protein
MIQWCKILWDSHFERFAWIGHARFRRVENHTRPNSDGHHSTQTLVWFPRTCCQYCLLRIPTDEEWGCELNLRASRSDVYDVIKEQCVILRLDPVEVHLNFAHARPRYLDTQLPASPFIHSCGRFVAEMAAEGMNGDTHNAFRFGPDVSLGGSTRKPSPSPSVGRSHQFIDRTLAEAIPHFSFGESSPGWWHHVASRNLCTGWWKVKAFLTVHRQHEDAGV